MNTAEEKEAALDVEIDVSLVLRCGACCYLIALAMYVNTLLLVVLNYRLKMQRAEARRRGAQAQRRPIRGSREEKAGDVDDTFMKYEEQRTQDHDEKHGDVPSHEGKQGEMKPDKTLKSARNSIRLPRAPKGHHVEELDQMEKFLAEDDNQ
ncbi:hypothetical protein Q1695_010820 [Nippostrongylus brasiliensis]|nr:hypothetical protein Q1695_010820 [Nippostrongylus brasiliensis]